MNPAERPGNRDDEVFLVGYPGTFQNIAQAIDRLRSEAPHYNLDISRTVMVGHSAGGHLAPWAAARAHLPQSSSLYKAEPFLPSTVISLGASAI